MSSNEIFHMAVGALVAFGILWLAFIVWGPE